MVNVFSGGIHRGGPPRGFQQMIVLPATGRIHTDIEVADQVFTAAHRAVERRFGPVPLSASSGLLVLLDSEEQLTLLEAAVAEAGHTDVCTLGVDVAAEHLLTEASRYRFG